MYNIQVTFECRTLFLASLSIASASYGHAEAKRRTREFKKEQKEKWKDQMEFGKGQEGGRDDDDA